MNVLHVDVVGGAAGDMLLAALLDVGAPRERVVEAVSSVLDRRVELETVQVRRGGLSARELRLPEDLSRTGYSPRGLVRTLENARLGEGVRRRAAAVLERLLEAEARVHGVATEELELEELGAEDTLLDVVGISAALEALGVQRMSVSSIPVPPLSSAGAHGAPAPVALDLLRGFAFRPSSAAAELPETVTPTAAAVFAALGEPAAEFPELTVDRIGYGAGARDPSSVANVVRVLLGTSGNDVGPGQRLAVIEANIDDLSPELVPDALEAISSAGARDAWASPIIMKGGRPAVVISALCDPAVAREVRRAFFETTTTLGVRMQVVMRPELERRIVEVELADGGPMIRVKLGLLAGRAVSAKPEHADVVEAAAKLGRSVRSVNAQASAMAHRLLEADG
jgi:hypothetical protein